MVIQRKKGGAEVTWSLYCNFQNSIFFGRSIPTICTTPYHASSGPNDTKERWEPRDYHVLMALVSLK